MAGFFKIREGIGAQITHYRIEIGIMCVTGAKIIQCPSYGSQGMRTVSKSVGTILVLLAVCLFGLPAYAKYSGGRGVPDDPYQIATAADLIALGETPTDYDKHFILTADIDLDPILHDVFRQVGVIDQRHRQRQQVVAVFHVDALQRIFTAGPEFPFEQFVFYHPPTPSLLLQRSLLSIITIRAGNWT